MLTQTALIVHCLTHKEGGGTGPASYLWAGVQWGRQRTYCADTASPRRSVVGLSCIPNPRARSWGFSSRLWSFSAMLDLLDVSCRRNVQADSLCRRTSASSVIPLVQSATGMSCLNAPPVELVSLSYLLSQHIIIVLDIRCEISIRKQSCIFCKSEFLPVNIVSKDSELWEKRVNCIVKWNPCW